MVLKEQLKRVNYMVFNLLKRGREKPRTLEKIVKRDLIVNSIS